MLIYSSSRTLLTSYKMLIHPILEYSLVVWDPTSTLMPTLLKSIQNFALKVISNNGLITLPSDINSPFLEEKLQK